MKRPVLLAVMTVLAAPTACDKGADDKKQETKAAPRAKEKAPAPAKAASKPPEPKKPVALDGKWSCTWSNNNKKGSGTETVTIVELDDAVEATFQGIEEARNYKYSGTWKGKRSGAKVEVRVLENASLESWLTLEVLKDGKVLKGGSSAKKGDKITTEYLCTPKS